MKLVSAMSLLLLIALSVPTPTLPSIWSLRIRTNAELAAKVAELAKRGVKLEEMPVLPVEDVRVGQTGVACTEVADQRKYVPVCLGDDAVYLSLGVPGGI